MPYAVAAKNVMLNHLGTLVTHLSAHTANPGSTGASECVGSGRGAVSWSSAASGSMSQSSNVSITNIDDLDTVKFIGMWGASSGGTYYGYQAISDIATAGGVPWTLVLTVGTVDLNANPSA